MFIEINDKRTVRDIQNEFHEVYPFLKLKFFRPGKDYEADRSSGDVALPDTLIEDIRFKHVPGLLDISPAQTTGRVEKHFKTRFGLDCQVCRLYGTKWLQTTNTDYFTLAQQNEKGMEASQPVNKLEIPDISDTMELE